MLEERKNNSTSIALGCVWMILLAVLSFLPSHDKLLLHTTGHYHRLGHLLGFLTLTLLLVNGATSVRTRFALATGVVSFGYLVEYIEHLVYKIPLERSDILIDTLGVIFGLIFVLVREEFNRTRRFD